jgi:ribosomal protein L11 methyltransferase
MADGVVRIALRVPAAAADVLEAALAQVAASVSRFEDAAAAGVVRVEAVAAGEFDRGDLDLGLALAAAASGVPAPPVELEALAERDWAAASRAAFPPFRLGGFLVHPGDHVEPLPSGAIGLALDAGLAFGSGRHGSTAGCLLALNGLRPHRFRKPLDVGCGSGILAIAMAKLWRVPVLACDIDPEAVAVTLSNARANGVGAQVRAVIADGCRARTIRAASPFDLVAANILARPLRQMAGDIAAVLAPAGRLVLSGFLAPEGAEVLAAYRVRGLRPVRRIVVDGWLTVILSR